MKELKGKTVVITGASGGLGAQLAHDAASLGAQLVLVSRNMEKLAAVKNNLKETFNVDALIYTLDVGNIEEVKAVFEEIIRTVSVDVLINNAGYGIFDYFVDADLNDLSGMLQTNVVGLMACTQSVLPQMIERRSGHIINIASQAGKISTPKSSGYAASKHAVLGFSNGLRMELADSGIQVTTVNPGPIETNFFSIADKSGTYEKNVKRWMLSPEYVSNRIISAIGRPVREINLPRWMNAGSTLYQLFPRLVEKLGGNAFKQK
ncbi:MULTISPECIES: SDR family NAD(P)-dependent oxidoreductase [Fictibacillus]|uniref:SDR family oxidoreductase n=1 Tax=Fictibacillus terranigra TaxID=3058424 RepID=A0ABT8E9T1_9BACL|nr:SDR family oxidoreductase [Fictibacillus sp. CENA-BCM004]MDN4074661.1 SDR family oxidoreductase [Fictibacillus sp. CENA-BCM004]